MGVDVTSQVEQAVFEAAFGIRDLEAREAFLLQACGKDAGQLARIRELLSTAREADSFFCDAVDARAVIANEASEEFPVFEIPLESDPEGLGSQIGAYTLLERIGEGGWGIVYLAEQQEPVRRRVAFKVIRRGLDTDKVIARFEAERQALALMEHPNIARVLDAGVTKTGRPYFVMELVRGVRITEHCDAQKLGIEERINLFIQVCQAIQHAHQKGVIHRDIKPSNILISSQDGLAVPKVIDFGIVRAAEKRLGEQTSLTGAEQFVGTPAYMSPEQAEGDPDLDTRSDVYSLGALLCELLTGATPFGNKRLAQAGMFETLRILREEEPPAPSALLLGLDLEQRDAAAKTRGTDPKHLVTTIRGDLDWIVLQALSKDRRQRYGTVSGLASDLQGYLDDQPVTARPPSRLYLLGKLVRRHKGLFVSAAAVALALIVGTAVSCWFYLKEREARRVQVRLREAAEEAGENANRLLQQTKARESISKAAVLLSEGSVEDADALLANVRLDAIGPAMEAAQVFRALGDWNAIRQRERKAVEYYALFLRANRLDRSATPPSWRVLLAIAPTLVEAGEIEDYRQFREDAIIGYGRAATPVNASGLLKACLLLPSDKLFLERLRKPAELVAKTLNNPTAVRAAGPFASAYMAMTMGLMEYRRGNFTQALEWSSRSEGFSETTQPRRACVHAISAMAAHRLGQSELATAELAAAKKIFERPFAKDSLYPGGESNGLWFDWAIARVLLRESVNLVESGVEPVR